MICRVVRGLSGNISVEGQEVSGGSLDPLPQEYNAFGTGDYRTTALRVRGEDGSQATELRVADYQVTRGKYALEGLPAVYADEKDAETLIVTLRDSFSGVTVKLLYGVIGGS